MEEDTDDEITVGALVFSGSMMLYFTRSSLLGRNRDATNMRAHPPPPRISAIKYY